MERDLTSGSVFRNIVFFSIPYLLSYFLQVLYGVADLFIIGQFEGVASTTAVSVGSQIMHMLTVMIVGLAMGTTVCIGQAVGAKNQKETALNVGNSATLFMILSILLAGVLLLFVKPIVSVLSTPGEAVSGTVAYLTICFIGVPFITAYNIVSSIFRGMGDSKSPMYFVAVACVGNILLDYLFIGFFRLGPAGAALGTTLSQTISVIVSLAYIGKKRMGLSVSMRDFRPQKAIMVKILKIGFPISLQDGLIQIAFIIITIIANMRGLTDAAAVGIVEKIICFLFLTPSAMLSTVSALGAQNIGAGKLRRAKDTLRYAIMIAAGYGIVVSGVILCIAEPVVGWFTPDASVIVAGGQYLRGYVWDCIFAGIHFCFSGYFCALGKSGLSFLHNIVAISLARVPGVYLTSQLFPDTLLPMGIATALGSLVSVIVCVVAYLLISRPRKETLVL